MEFTDGARIAKLEFSRNVGAVSAVSQTDRLAAGAQCKS
jgi:hypothetical protein